MSTRVNSAGRVQPTEGRYLATPGTCAICNKVPTSPDEIFANPGIELEFHGVLYFCVACCLELSAFVMAVPEDRAMQLVDANIELGKRNHYLMNQVTYLKGLLDARIDLAGSGEPISDGVVGLPISQVELDAAEIDRITNKYKSEPSESSSID